MNMNSNVSTTIDQLNYAMMVSVLPVTIFIGIETLVGLIGNSLILVVYSRHYCRSNFRCFVLSMAIIDLTSCLTTLPGEIFSQMNWYTYKYAWICKVKSFFNVFTAWGSASVLLLLGVDRYRKIRRPLQWQIQPSKAKKLCGIFFVLSSIAAFPALFLWGTQSYAIEFHGMKLNVSICEKAEEYADGIYPLIFITTVYVFPLGIMVCIVSFLNTLTAKSLFGTKMPLLKGRPTLVKTLTNVSSITTASDTDTASYRCPDNLSGVYKDSLPRLSTSTTIAEMDLPGCTPDDGILTLAKGPFESKTDPPEDKSSCRSGINAFIPSNLVNGPVVCKPDNENSHGEKKTSSIRRTNSIEVFVISENDQNNSSVLRKSVTNRAARNDSLRQKTIIMLVLTNMFLLTMCTYVILTFFVAGREGVLKSLTNSEKVAFFFFWRLYFINTNINPIIYGYMDPRFRTGLLDIVKVKLRKQHTSRH